MQIDTRNLWCASIAIVAASFTTGALAGCSGGATVVAGSSRASDVAESSTTSSSVTSSPLVSRASRLTPESLPPLASDAQLEEEAIRTPKSQRRLVGLDANGVPLGWAVETGNVYPVFATDDDRLRGIYVSGLGVVSRSTYEQPDFDSEAAAKAKWGAEYELRLKVKGGEGFGAEK